MPILIDAGTAYAAVLGGITIAYVELLRPGLILPGVAGATLALLGLSAFLQHAADWRALWLLLAACAIALADALWGLRGFGALSAGVLMSFAVRWLVAGKLSLLLASGLSIPFLLLTWWLVKWALLARAWKTAI